MFSVLILARDEETNLPACLDSLKWCDDIWLINNHSTDKTVEIAEARGVHVLTNTLVSFGQQRNWGIDNCKFKHEWVFDLDADERFTEVLRLECEEKIREDSKSAYYVANKMMLFDRWIKHASQFPVYQMRFHKLGEVRFLTDGHGQREGTSERGLGYMKEAYIHYNFSKGLADWFLKHAQYAYLESAQQIEDERRGLTEAGGTDAMARRRKLKQLASRMPCRPLLKFVYCYFVKCGFLDGRAGFLYCCMLASFEFAKTTVYKDLKRQLAKDPNKTFVVSY